MSIVINGLRITSIPVTLSSATIEYLLVAGGGGGGGAGLYPNASGGGGAGGFRTGNLGSFSTFSGSTFTISVGAGGSGGDGWTTAPSGSNSSISYTGTTLTSIGGGGGDNNYYGGHPAGNGGSGGGGATGGGTGGTGIVGQGHNGGDGYIDNYVSGGGGGGANTAGSAGTSSLGGNGGNGANSSISGTNTAYAGGGGGGGPGRSDLSTIGYGGVGGGGNAGMNTGSNGGANLGGGGGGATGNSIGNTTGGNGGSGVVIIRYANTESQSTTTGSSVYNNLGGYHTYKFTGAGTIQIGVPPPPWTDPSSYSGLVGWYDVSSVSGSTWTDKSGSGNHATISGASVGSTSGNGASITSALIGNSGTSVTWPSGILPSTYTLFHVTRLQGTNNSRIFNGRYQNWLSGFWGGGAGVAYHNGWITSTSKPSAITLTNWLISTDQNNLYRGNGVDYTTGSAGSPSYDVLSINNSNSGEYSDYMVVEVIVYNRTLTSGEYITVENYLQNKYGIS